MPLPKRRARLLGREPSNQRVEAARDAAREFSRIALAEAIYELGQGGLDDEDFEELLAAARRKMPAVFKAAARHAVFEAIRETDPNSYTQVFGTAGYQGSAQADSGSAEASCGAQTPSQETIRLAEIEERKQLLDLPFVTREEAAKILQCSVDTIDRRLRDETLKDHRIGRKPMVLTQSIVETITEGPSVCESLSDLTQDEFALRQNLTRD